MLESKNGTIYANGIFCNLDLGATLQALDQHVNVPSRKFLPSEVKRALMAGIKMAGPVMEIQEVPKQEDVYVVGSDGVLIGRIKKQ
jgi:hypothetical protein